MNGRTGVPVGAFVRSVTHGEGPTIAPSTVIPAPTVIPAKAGTQRQARSAPI